MTTLIACSHGTSDEAGRLAVRVLVEQIRSRLPGVRVVQAFVDVEQPEIAAVTANEAASDSAIVVPLLLSAGFHTAVDIARAVAAVPNARQSQPLGTHTLIAAVLADRLSTVIDDGWQAGDHVVLAAAGSSNPAAVRDVEEAAEHLRQLLPVPVSVGFASASSPRIADAVATARAEGAVRVIAASHVLAPGYFAGLVARAGADLVTAPLAPDQRVADVAVERFVAAEHSVAAERA